MNAHGFDEIMPLEHGEVSFDALRNVVDSGMPVIRPPSGNSANLTCHKSESEV